MRRSLARRVETRRGSPVIEFALTLPFLLMLAVGIAEFGLLVHQGLTVSRAARDAARVGSGVIEGPEPTGDQIEEAAIEHAKFALGAANIDCDTVDCDISAEWFEDDNETWMVLEVTVTVPFVSPTNLVPGVPEEVTRSFIMLTQQQMPEDLGEDD